MVILLVIMWDYFAFDFNDINDHCKSRMTVVVILVCQ
jgi:hypothetical protein